MEIILDYSKLEVLIKMFEEEPKTRSLINARGAYTSYYAAKIGYTSAIEYLRPAYLGDRDGFGDTIIYYAVSHS